MVLFLATMLLLLGCLSVQVILKLSELVKQGGKFYIWLYIRPKTLYTRFVYAINSLIRVFLRRLSPDGVYIFSQIWIYPMRFYHRLRGMMVVGDPYFLRLSKRDHLLELYDHFAIAYDWHHTYKEVFGWFKDSGYIPKAIKGINSTKDYKTHGVSVVGIKRGS